MGRAGHVPFFVYQERAIFDTLGGGGDGVGQGDDGEHVEFAVGGAVSGDDSDAFNFLLLFLFTSSTELVSSDALGGHTMFYNCF